MNDFTKEELETIFLDMNHSILKYGKENVAPFYLELRDKVEKMIDNYCEHETSNDGYCPGLYAKVIADKEIMAKDLVRIYECDKCGEYYKESFI